MAGSFLAANGPGGGEVPAEQRWRSIPNFPLYEAGSTGDIRRSATGVILSACRDSRGYAKVTITDASGRLRSVWVHRLVCAAFHGPPEPGQEARHLNGVKTDCSAHNLCWGARTANAEDRKAHMAGKSLSYSGLRPHRRVAGAPSTVRSQELGRFLGSKKTIRSIRQAFRSGLISKIKAIDLIKSL